jgi:hypothetical protein
MENNKSRGAVTMSNRDKLQGATNVFTMYFAYLNGVARQMGIDKAIALSAEVDKAMGGARGRMIKENSGGAEFDAITAAAAARKSILDDFGIESKPISENADKVVTQCGQCPVYDGAQVAGLDSGTIEAQCRDCSIGYMDALVKQLNPNLTYRLSKFRSAPGEPCEEEIVME